MDTTLTTPPGENPFNPQADGLEGADSETPAVEPAPWPPVAPLDVDGHVVSSKMDHPATLDALARFIREDDATANTVNADWLLKVIPTAAGTPFQPVDRLKHNGLYIFQHDRAMAHITVSRLRATVAGLPGAVLAARQPGADAGVWSLIAGPPARDDPEYRTHWLSIHESIPPAVRGHTSPACPGMAEPVSVGHDPDAWLADSMPEPHPGAGSLEEEPGLADLELNGGLPDDAVADEPDPPPPAPQGAGTDAVLVSLCYKVTRSQSDMGPAEPLDDVIARWKSDQQLCRLTETVRNRVADLAAAQAHLDSLDDDDPVRPEAESAVAQAKARKKAAKLELPSHTYGAVVSGPRNQGSIVRLSRMVPVDIDGEGESAADLRDRLGALPYMRAARVSVSGTGVHGVVPVDGMDMEASGRAAVPSFKRGVKLVKARILEDVGRTLDPAVSNPVSVLYECYDPDAIDNPDCEHLVLEPAPCRKPKAATKEPPAAGPAPHPPGGQDTVWEVSWERFLEALAVLTPRGQSEYNLWICQLNRLKAGGMTLLEADAWCMKGETYEPGVVEQKWDGLDPTESQWEAWNNTIAEAVKLGLMKAQLARKPIASMVDAAILKARQEADEHEQQARECRDRADNLTEEDVRAEIIRDIEKRTGIVVKSLKRYTGDAGRYLLETTGGRTRLDSFLPLLSNVKAREIFTRTDINLVPRMNQKAWDEVAQLLRYLEEDVDLGTTGKLDEEMHDWVVRYVQDHPPLSEAHFKERWKIGRFAVRLQRAYPYHPRRARPVALH